jgi:hypothetical protein
MGLFNHSEPMQPEIVEPLGRERIKSYLNSQEYNFRTDDDGDVFGLFDGHPFWFFLMGEQEEILQVRGRWRPSVDEGRAVEVAQIVNDWNRDRIWPKAYTRTENGEIFVYSEVSVDFEHGATDGQIAQTMACGLATGVQFFEHLTERLTSDV